MADNVNYNPSGTTAFATKDDGSAHHQKVIVEGQNLAGSVIGLGKAEDEAHSTGDGGIMALGVRQDAAAALAGTDGDYQPMIFDASGRLWVNPSGVTQPISAASLPLPTGAATSALQGGGLPSALATDRLKVDGSGVTQPVSGTVTANAGTGTLSVDGSGVTQPISAASLPLPTGAATSALQGGGLPAALGAQGALKVEGVASGTAVPISAAALPLPSDASSATLQGGGLPSALSSDRLKTEVVGNIAHDTGDSGNPVLMGARAVSALPAVVTTDDRVRNIADLFGRQLVGHIDAAMQISKAYNTTGQQTGADVWTPASGKRIAVTSVVIGSYGTTGARLILWFGDNADTTYTAGTDQVLLAASFVPSATVKPGLVFTPTVPVFCTTVDREIHITTDAALSVDITLYGYEW